MIDTKCANFLQNVLNSDNIKNLNKIWIYIISIYYNIIINDSKYLSMYQEINNNKEDLENNDDNEINEHEIKNDNMKTE